MIQFNNKTATKANTTNRPLKCEICDKVYWSYNLKTHFELMHNNIAAPNVVSDEEIDLIKKKLNSRYFFLLTILIFLCFRIDFFISNKLMY